MKINDSVFIITSIGKTGYEGVRDLRSYHIGDEVFKRFGVEFVARDLTLGVPEVAVDAEDAVSEEFVEDIVVAGTFDVVGEVGDEEVLDVDGVRRANAVGGEVEEGVDLESG